MLSKVQYIKRETTRSKEGQKFLCFNLTLLSISIAEEPVYLYKKLLICSHYFSAHNLVVIMDESQAQTTSSASENPDLDEFLQIIKSMGDLNNPTYLVKCCKDGVLRQVNADRKVIKAVPLRPGVIKAFWGHPKLTEEYTRQWDGVDGTKVPEELWYNPDESLIRSEFGPPLTKEEQEQRIQKFYEITNEITEKHRQAVEKYSSPLLTKEQQQEARRDYGLQIVKERTKSHEETMASLKQKGPTIVSAENLQQDFEDWKSWKLKQIEERNWDEEYPDYAR